MDLPTKKIEKFRETYEEEHSCTCPHCGYDMNNEPEDMQDLVTYWGEEGKLKQECNSCDGEFFVEEHVDRTWSVHLVESYMCCESDCDEPAIMQEQYDQPCECLKHFKPNHS